MPFICAGWGISLPLFFSFMLVLRPLVILQAKIVLQAKIRDDDGDDEYECDNLGQ